MNCPQCGSYAVVSNHLPEPEPHHIMHAIQSAKHVGAPIVAIGAVSFWGVMKGINSCRFAYKCENCGKRFD